MAEAFYGGAEEEGTDDGDATEKPRPGRCGAARRGGNKLGSLGRAVERRKRRWLLD